MTKKQIKRSYLRGEISATEYVNKLIMELSLTRREAFKLLNLANTIREKGQPEYADFDFSLYISRTDLKKLNNGEREKFKEMIISREKSSTSNKHNLTE